MDNHDLDRFSAELVMGWVYDEDLNIYRYRELPIRFAPDWCPAIDIVQCMELIVPAMLKKGFLFSLCHQAKNQDGTYRFEAAFEPIVESGDCFGAVDNSPSRAIVEAAILAVRG